MHVSFTIGRDTGFVQEEPVEKTEASGIIEWGQNRTETEEL